MFQFEINEAVIVEQQKVLEAALSTNPKTQAVLRKIIHKYVKDARAQVVNNINFNNGDPHSSAQAVRTAVYKKVLGANINIFDSRKAHGTNNYEPLRKLRPGQRGGNRLPRGTKTQRMMSYAPLDRGMILRWNNDGTGERETKYGKRGSITARHFFRPLGDRALGVMRNNLATAIEEELTKLLN